MTTLFALLEQNCGLSHQEAANFLNTRVDTVKSWASGRRTAPADVLNELRNLSDTIDRAASEALALIREKAATGFVELGYAADDYEARQLGWPCVGAQQAMLGRVIAGLRGVEVVLSPRGSTPGTAGAAGAHERYL